MILLIEIYIEDAIVWKPYNYMLGMENFLKDHLLHFLLNNNIDKYKKIPNRKIYDDNEKIRAAKSVVYYTIRSALQN
jgi:hypothetical protein